MKFDQIEHLSGLNFLGLSPIGPIDDDSRRQGEEPRGNDGDCDPDPAVVMAAAHGHGWPRADHHWIDSLD